MANESESNETPERDDSGLQDILAVAAKIKDAPASSKGDAEDPSGGDGEDSGMILFSAGDLSKAGADEDGEDAMFGSFAGGLAAGFGSSLETDAADLSPAGSGGAGVLGSVAETSAPEVRPAPSEEPKRNPLTVLAVVLGLGLVAAGAVYLTHEDKPESKPPAQAEMSASSGDPAVGKADPSPDPGVESGAGASAGAALEPGSDPEANAEVGVEGGEGLLAAADTSGVDDSDADDPMGQKQGLLEGGSNPVAKAGKWDGGTSLPSKSASPSSSPTPSPDPEPDPVAAPEPTPPPTSKPAAGGGNDDEVDCLLNPDLPKCSSGGSSKPKHDEILAPKLPDKLDQTALRNGFNKVKTKAKACGSKHGAAAGTAVKIHASIEGESGKVTSVKATGEHAGTELGKCVEGAVEGAVFEPFKKPSQGVDYSLIM
jgi:hypothetical protein